MLPRKELVALVKSRLEPALPPDALEKLILEIENLGKDWEELNPSRLDGESCRVVNCLDCWFEEQQSRGADIKMYLKRPEPAHEHVSSRAVHS